LVACGAEAACEDKVIGDSCGAGGTCNSNGQCRECNPDLNYVPDPNYPLEEKNPDCVDASTQLTGTCSDVTYNCLYPSVCNRKIDCAGDYCCTKDINVQPTECVELATLKEEDRQICAS